jgi:hypothetical protein
LVGDGVNSIDYQIDRMARRVLIRFVGDVDGAVLRDTMATLWREFPEVRSCDSMCDMREFSGDLPFDDIRALAEAWRLFCGGADLGRRTAVVSRDRFAPLYIRAIALCFAGRELAVFRTLEEAECWLDRRE